MRAAAELWTGYADTITAGLRDTIVTDAGGVSVPTQEGFAAPPKGVVLETPEEIRARAAMINQQVWVTRVMPPGNLTHMTDAERRLIARWFKGGAE